MPSSPSFTAIGYGSQVEPSQDPDLQDINAVGTENVVAYTLGKQQDLFKITYNPVDSNFIKRAANAVSWTTPTGTIAETFSMLYSILMNGAENFITLNGCRINTMKLSLTAGNPLKVDAEVWAQYLNAPTTSPPAGTPVYASQVTGAPWNYSDGGTTPVTIGGVNIPLTEIELDIATNLKRLHVLQSTKQIDVPPTKRGFTGKMTVVWSSAAYMTDLEALTESSLIWNLKNSVSTLTLTNMVFKKLDSLTTSPDDVVYEKYDFSAMSCAVT